MTLLLFFLLRCATLTLTFFRFYSLSLGSRASLSFSLCRFSTKASRSAAATTISSRLGTTVSTPTSDSSDASMPLCVTREPAGLVLDGKDCLCGTDALILRARCHHRCTGSARSDDLINRNRTLPKRIKCFLTGFFFPVLKQRITFAPLCIEPPTPTPLRYSRRRPAASPNNVQSRCSLSGASIMNPPRFFSVSLFVDHMVDEWGLHAASGSRCRRHRYCTHSDPPPPPPSFPSGSPCANALFCRIGCSNIFICPF